MWPITSQRTHTARLFFGSSIAAEMGTTMAHNGQIELALVTMGGGLCSITGKPAAHGFCV